MDELAVAGTGTAGHYLTLDLPCNNKKLAIIPLPIRMPNREIITSTHTSLLSKSTHQLNNGKHIFSRYQQSLAVNWYIFDNGFQAVFYDNTVLILNKGNGKIIMKGKRDPLLNLYMLNLTHRNKLITEFQTPDEYFTGSVYECKSKGTLVD